MKPTSLQGLCAEELVDIKEALASCEGEDEECSPSSAALVLRSNYKKRKNKRGFFSPKTKCSLLLLTLPNLCSFWYTHTHPHILQITTI